MPSRTTAWSASTEVGISARWAGRGHLAPQPGDPAPGPHAYTVLEGAAVTPYHSSVTDYDDLDMFGGLDASALPSRQQRILATIRDWVAAHGCTPSTRQIGDAVGLRSTSSVSKHLKSLEEKGFLRRGTAMARQLDARPFLAEATRGRSSENNVTVPVVGDIAAGAPILAEEHADEMLTLPRELVGSGTVTLSSDERPCVASARNGRTSNCRAIAVPLRRKPFSSRLFRCLDTDDVDRRPTASPICRVLGVHPCAATQSRIVARIRCWRDGRVEASRPPNMSRSS